MEILTRIIQKMLLPESKVKESCWKSCVKILGQQIFSGNKQKIKSSIQFCLDSRLYGLVLESNQLAITSLKVSRDRVRWGLKIIQSTHVGLGCKQLGSTEVSHRDGWRADKCQIVTAGRKGRNCVRLYETEQRSRARMTLPTFYSINTIWRIQGQFF